MNPKHPRRHPLPLLLFACLSLALLAPCTQAQRRRPAPPAARKPAANKPAPTPEPARVEPTAQAPTSGRRALIRWRGRAGIDRYRLQVARDRNFSDIVFDRAVTGFEYEVELPQGDGFFWRVAPAAQETGEYSAPEPVLLSTAAPSVLRSARDVGWQALVGEVLRPQPAPLRGTGAFDVVAVNAEGMVFALDGANGSALWTARYRPNARRDDPPKSPANIFTPVVIPVAEGGKANVVAAFDGGVRALEGESGRELWRVPLSGAALGGTVADLDDDKVLAELAIVTDEPALHFIDARTGRVNAKEKLDGALIGGPIPFLTDTQRGVAVTLAGGMLDVRRFNGSRFGAVKFDVPFTTPPLVFTGPNGTIVVLGTEHGLLFLNGTDLKPLGKVTLPDDGPRGRLAASDIDHDGVLEIVSLLKSGKIVVITGTGMIRWKADGASDAYTPTFSDLNGDGILDVLVPSAHMFAAGYNGRDGSLLWQVDEAKGTQTTTGDAALRSLAIINTGAGSPLVVSGDQGHAGVRAVALPVAVTVKIGGQQ